MRRVKARERDRSEEGKLVDVVMSRSLVVED